ncbi:MAG: hypothetical protein RBR45_11715 [Pseudomonas sp.]|nr:hypothetical protein [Pseudomonas sp.]
MILGCLLITLFFHAIYHFVIDGIIAPTERMIFRQKVFVDEKEAN